MQGEDLFVAGLSGGLIVLSGGLYALFFALGRLRGSRALEGVGYAAYVILVAGAFALVTSLRMNWAWTGVIAFALLGYLLLPRAIWHLCVGTHGTKSR